MLFLSLHILV
jgi:far upstream element-binding protein